jgi:hypothetical protein
VKDTGATIDDVKKLETLLRLLICVKTLTGEVLHDGKYKNKRTSIDIYDHNGHAWTETVMIFPRERKVRYIQNTDTFYEGKLFDAIYELNKNDPVSVWLLSSEQDCEVGFDQFVTTRGELYRTEELNNRMINICKQFIGENSLEFTDDENFQKLLTNSFTVSSVLAHYAREKNSWRKTPNEFLNDIKSSCVEYYHG